ncbi:MAG: hypothetical protein ACFFD4_35610 [Candidatus Odinarchaeota archaeon]
MEKALVFLVRWNYTWKVLNRVESNVEPDVGRQAIFSRAALRAAGNTSRKAGYEMQLETSR